MTASTHTSDQWGVLVNEAGIFATRRGSDWWVEFWTNYSTRDNWTVLEPGFAGGWYHIAFDSRDDAEFAREHMAGKGIAESHLKVMTLSAARRSVGRKQKHAVADTPGAGKTVCGDAA